MILNKYVFNKMDDINNYLTQNFPVHIWHGGDETLFFSHFFFTSLPLNFVFMAI